MRTIQPRLSEVAQFIMITMLDFGKIFIAHSRCSFFAVVVACLCGHMSMTWASDLPQSSPTKLEAFSALSLSEQKQVLKNTFEERLKKMENIYYCMETYVYGDTVSERDVALIRQFKHWQLRTAYRMDVEQIPKNSKVPNHLMSFAFDPREGEIRGTFRPNESVRKFGRIDNSANPTVWDNRYRIWLNQEFALPGADSLDDSAYIFANALKQHGNWAIISPFENQKIQLTHDYQRRSDRVDGGGKRTLVLDPEKDFLPIQGHWEWEGIPDGDGKRRWEKKTFVVEKSEVFNGVWMPLVIQESIRWHVHPDLVIIKITVKDMTIGNVTASDITLKFDEGTEVTDAIKGIFYKTDARGEPIQSTIKPLYGLDPSQVKMPEPPKSKVNLVLMTIGIVMIIIGLYLAIQKRLRKSS